MHIEFRHLRTIKAIHDTGSLSRAADQLAITQSALSHQIKGIEDQAQVALFVRRAKPLRLSAAGLRMLAVAETVLPQIAALEAEFDGMREGSSGRLHITLECHACFEWLVPVLEKFRKIWPQIDVDIRPGLAFDAINALRKEDVDLVITSDPETAPEMEFTALFDYEPVFVAAASHRLAGKQSVEAEDFVGETLITYPVDPSRLDIFNMLLNPARVSPARVRQVELTAVILMLVASGQGVSVLPDWVVRTTRQSEDFLALKITRKGLTRRMFAATRQGEKVKPYLAYFLRLAGQEAVKLQRGL